MLLSGIVGGVTGVVVTLLVALVVCVVMCMLWRRSRKMYGDKLLRQSTKQNSVLGNNPVHEGSAVITH